METYGTSSQSGNGLAKPPLLFPESDLPTFETAPEKNFQSLRHPLWTENKARLIQEYIKLFTYITKHGAYIDGFAAPQRRDRVGLCSAKLVLEAEPKRVRELWLCDKAPEGIQLLNEIGASHIAGGRQVHVVAGDFNKTIEGILASGRIKEKTATFALLDQRMFECAWATVERLAQHKSDRKIELFYFFASGWVDKSIAAVKRPQKAAEVERWWGKPDWRDLKGMNSAVRAQYVARRFKEELGYRYAYPYSIHDKKQRGRTMYHMIHATDHEEAPLLMIRAYRKVSGRSEIDPATAQLDLDTLWREIQEESLG